MSDRAPLACIPRRTERAPAAARGSWSCKATQIDFLLEYSAMNSEQAKTAFHIRLTKDKHWNSFTGLNVDFSEPTAAENEVDAVADASKQNKQPTPATGFQSIQKRFLTDMEPFFVSFTFMLLIAQTHRDSLISQKLKQFCESNAIRTSKTDDEIDFLMSRDYDIVKQFFDILQEITVATQSMIAIPRTYIMQLCSLFDLLVSSIASEVIRQRPNILNSSDRNIEYGDLYSFSTIDEIKEHFSNKFVEGLIRKNRRNQFKWLEGVLKAPLTKDLLSWPDFVEINERRNLITHADGVVSAEYISNVNSAGLTIGEEIKIGTKLGVTFEYYKNAVNVFYEIGIKLIQVVWRIITPTEIELADSELIRAGYRMLLEGRYSLAEEVHRFACETLPRHSSDENKKILIINYANAFNLQDKQEQSKNIIDAHDWSASDFKFRISAAAVKNDAPKVASLLREAGTNGLSNADYQEWPVFKKVRETNEFRNAYEEVFKTPFQPRVPTTKVNIAQIKELLTYWDAGDGVKPEDIPQIIHSARNGEPVQGA
jgi:hypothetical protein